MKPLLITGVGVVSPVGIGREAFFEAMRVGAKAPFDRPVESFDVSAYEAARPNHLAVAEVPGFDAAKYLGDRGLRTLDRLSKLLIVAARLALHDAGLKTDGAWRPLAPGEPPWAERVGLVVSNAYGSLEAISELDRIALLEDARYINPSRFPLTVSNTPAGYVSIWEDLRALNVSVSDGNCGAIDAVGCADALLAGGRADVLLVGGAEAMSEALFVAFDRLGTFGARARPRAPAAFSEGARLGEGAALVAVEPERAGGGGTPHTPSPREGRTSPREGRTVLAEIAGYSASFAPPPRSGSLLYAAPEALDQAIAGALADAGVAAQEVDLVVSGVSGVRPFDDAELTAIGRALGDAACVVAPKLALGETLGAGGAMAILAAIAYMREGARGYAVRGEFRPAIRTVVVTSLGYYGNASALVMRASPR